MICDNLQYDLEPLRDTNRNITVCRRNQKCVKAGNVYRYAGVGKLSVIKGCRAFVSGSLKALNYRLVYGKHTVMYIDYVR